MSPLRTRPTVLAAIVSGGLVVRIALALAPLDFLLAHLVADDSFYYLTIARRLVSEGVPTFDGLTPTNGFHPLWLVITSGVTLISSDPDVVFRMVMLLQAGIEAASVLLLYRVALSLGARGWTAYACSALYAFSPVILTQAGGMNGMETSLSNLALLLVLRVAAPVVTNPYQSIPASALASSAAALVMARLDMTFACGAIFLVLFVRRRHDRRARALLAIAMAVPMGLVMTLLAFNLLVFGDPIPVSARSIGWVSHDFLKTQQWTSYDWAVRIAGNYVRTLTFVPFGLVVVKKTIVASAVLVAGLAVVLGRHRFSFRQSRWKHGAAWLVGSLVVAWLAFGLMQTLRMPPQRSWYHGLWMVPATLAAGRLTDACLFGAGYGAWRSVRVRLMAVIAMAAVGLATVNALARTGRDAVRYAMVMHAVRVIPAGTNVGAWNAGILGFFAPTLRVVNLDGVVNNEAWRYIRLRRLGDYVRRVRIAYLVDDFGSFHVWERYWSNRSGSLRSSAVEYARLPIPNTDDTLALIGVPSHVR